MTQAQTSPSRWRAQLQWVRLICHHLLTQYLCPWQHRALIGQLAVREVRQKFQGSWLGLGWAIVTPIAMLAVYTFVFRTVLNVKWPGSEGASDAEFALQLFSGLVVFTLFSDVVARAPGLISEQPNMVKKVIFPLAIMPWVSVVASLFFAMLSMIVLVLGSWLATGRISVHLLELPVVILAFLPVLLGLGWLLSSLGVYLRDLGHIVSLLLSPLMFLSPIFYPLTSLPEWIQGAMLFNPLTVIIDAVRQIVLHHQLPDFQLLGIYGLVALAGALLGAACFQKTRRGFADVL